MNKLNLLPKGDRAKISDMKVDSLLMANFPFTRLDSTVAEMQLAILTGQYPFTPKGTLNYKVLNFKIKDIVDFNSSEFDPRKSQLHSNEPQTFQMAKKY